MKKALLWLCPLACLALACLYAYSWYSRGPLEIAFDRIEVGMTLEEAHRIIGVPTEKLEIVFQDYGEAEANDNYIVIWADDDRRYQIVIDENGRVVSKHAVRSEETLMDKFNKWIRNPTSLWAANPPAPPSLRTAPIEVIERSRYAQPSN